MFFCRVESESDCVCMCVFVLHWCACSVLRVVVVHVRRVLGLSISFHPGHSLFNFNCIAYFLFDAINCKTKWKTLYRKHHTVTNARQKGRSNLVSCWRVRAVWTSSSCSLGRACHPVLTRCKRVRRCSLFFRWVGRACACERTRVARRLAPPTRRPRFPRSS